MNNSFTVRSSMAGKVEGDLFVTTFSLIIEAVPHPSPGLNNSSIHNLFMIPIRVIFLLDPSLISILVQFLHYLLIF